MPNMLQAPTLETDRLLLRAHQRSDYDALHAIWSDPKVIEFIGGKPSLPQDSWFRLMRYLGHWPLLGFGYFALCEKKTGAYIGDMGIANHKRGLHPNFDDAPETGWVLSPNAFGKGYATEAMEAVLAWFHTQFGPLRTVCMIEAANLGSQNVAAKLGYFEFDQIVLAGKTILLFERF